MNNVLYQFKKAEINAEQLRHELGNDLYNVTNIKAEKIYAKDVSYVIKLYLSKAITLQSLLDWVNIIWFTDLFVYNSAEENTISSVITVLETLDEDDAEINDDDLLQMIEALNNNTDYSVN